MVAFNWKKFNFFLLFFGYVIFELSIHLKIMEKGIMVSTNILKSICFQHLKWITWTANQYIQMISEGSYDTKDWSNGCWKISFAITGINHILKYSQIENSQLYCFTILLFYCIHNLINAAWVTIRPDPDIFKWYVTSSSESTNIEPSC